MRIAFITQPWAGIGEGGAIGLLTCKIASSLAHSEEVIIYGKRGECSENKDIRYRHIKINYERIIDRLLKNVNKIIPLGSRERPFYTNILYYSVYAVRIALDIRKQKVDVVHIHMLSQFIPIIKYFNPGVKIVLHNHLEWLNQLSGKMLTKRLAMTDMILECSSYNRQLVINRFPELKDKCRVLYNGVDMNRFGNKARKAGNERLQLLFVGRISPEKGVHVLLEAFAMVWKKHKNIELTIIGGDVMLPYGQLVDLSSRKDIKDLTRFYGKGNYHRQMLDYVDKEVYQNVTFTGFIPNRGLPHYYNRADIFINSSLIEAFPLPVVEAMAGGLAVAAAAVGGIPEAIQDGTTGLLFPGGDSRALAGVIERLVEDSSLRERLGENARRMAEERFSWENIACGLLKSYRGLMNQTAETGPDGGNGTARSVAAVNEIGIMAGKELKKG